MNGSNAIINLNTLPEIATLKQLCKALATLDAIISPDWESRYYSYDKDWGPNEECFSMRDGSGDEFLILFSSYGAVINGFAHDSTMSNWKERELKPTGFREKILSLFGNKKTTLEQHIYAGVVDDLPAVFRGFVFDEPIKSIGTTFCIWRESSDTAWKRGNISFPDDDYGDGSADLLYILDNKPETYRKWALEYYEDEFESNKLKLDLVRHIYEHQPLTKEIVYKINPGLADIESLKRELDRINYLHKTL